MKPCERCNKRIGKNGDRCDEWFFCFEYRDWKLEQIKRIEYEKHADPQEPEPSYRFRDDDREV